MHTILPFVLLIACGPPTDVTGDSDPSSEPVETVDTDVPETDTSTGDTGEPPVPCGTFRSVQMVGGPGDDTVSQVAAGLDGSLYAQGASFDGSIVFGAGGPLETTVGPVAGFIARYEPDGEFAWVRTISSITGLYLAGTSDGGVVAVGTTFTSVTVADGQPDAITLPTPDGRSGIIARFDASGALLWAVEAASVAHVLQFYVVVLPDDSVMFTGTFNGRARFGPGEAGEIELEEYPSTEATGYVARFGPDGTVLWARRFGGSNRVMGSGITLDPVTGEILVAGWLAGSGVSEFPADPPVQIEALDGSWGFASRWNTDGEVLWVTRLGASPTDIEAAGDGSLLLFGSISEPAVFGAGEALETTLVPHGMYEMFTARLDPTGRLLWAKQSLSTPEYGLTFANGGGATEDGGAVVTGSFSTDIRLGDGEANAVTFSDPDSGIFSDAYVARFDPSGGLVCAVQVVGGLHGYGLSVAARPDGSWTVAGALSGAARFGAGTPEAVDVQSDGPADGFLATWVF